MPASVECRCNSLRGLVFFGLLVGAVVLASATTRAAESYQVDPAHTSTTFRI